MANNLCPNRLVPECLLSKCIKHDLGACLVYSCPEAKWLFERRCPMAPRLVIAKEVKHVDPLKKSKKMMKGDR